MLDIGKVASIYDGDANLYLLQYVNGGEKINILDLGVITDNYE